MIKIKRALISVSDKSGIVDLVKELNKLKVEILSTGGTAKLLRENNVAVKDVSEYTDFPEILDGRVKTLHPKVHGGLLALRDNEEHMNCVKEHGINMIDMVVVNLYPFEQIIKKPKVKIEEIIENIDIGGPSMLRSAAKNYRFVVTISSPLRYAQVIEALRKNAGGIPEDMARDLAIEAFGKTAAYDTAINKYFKTYFSVRDKSALFPEELVLSFKKIQDLRYGENPHQKAAFYREPDRKDGLVGMKKLQGKELSFNNILDLNSALELLKEFQVRPAAVIVKHNNPCGVAEEDSLEKAYLNALKCDKLSAFGGIVALNSRLDIKTAKAIAKSGFLECIVAPGFADGSLDFFKNKKNLRILEISDLDLIEEMDFKRISEGLLLQDKDIMGLPQNNLKVVTLSKPTKKEMESLLFAWKVAKHVKSNAIVFAKGTKTIGIGAGQMSRVDSVVIAKKKAGILGKGSCLASDAFFPKPDSILWAHKAGVKAIIQPGGSIADEEIIKACNKYKIAMVTTGIRYFRH
ncbi:MAG: bifunctional phosphoribosylaminoimidazolecarboxamide formyltransferase/IMP cyclohydrolase [Candidatus Omnitrophica bacterium]|nr:bifunctional phosphoribosylaminoimidazolecarboxamide formyltransferase/IMP cyclohydrolase [Candidatus Omnitrophota bacterium]